MAEYLIQDSTLTDIANAVRTKTGKTGSVTPSQMASELNAIPNQDSSSLTVSGATVSVPAGNYKTAASKSVATATQATPSVSIDSAGKITATATQTAGYVAAGTKTGTKQLTVQAAKTVTPSTSEQTAVASGVYTTGAVKVAAMPTATQATPSISIDSAGKITASATQTAGYVAAGTKTGTKQMTVKAATTWTPKTSNQTIASGTYLTGTQTIKGDSNLKAANIKKGVSIFGVSGSYDAAELNFTVVGGTSQPSSPAANTIWVNTSTTITKWSFSAEEPANSTDGMVWFQTGDTAQYIEFNALKSNEIQMRPVKVYQRKQGAWSGDLSAKIYQNGAWVDMLNFLFKDGWINAATGGFYGSQDSTTLYYGNSTMGTGGNKTYTTKKAVSLTNVKSIGVEFSPTITSSGMYFKIGAITSSKNGETVTDSGYAAVMHNGSNETLIKDQKYTWNLTVNLTGNYYIAYSFGLFESASGEKSIGGKVHKIWLKT